MKKPQNSMFNLQSFKYGDGRFKKRSNEEDKNKKKRRRSFYELISVIWPLAFLFYCGVCLSDGNGEFLIPNANISSSNNGNNQSHQATEDVNESAPISLSNSIDLAPIELNVSINLNVTTKNGYKTLSTSCLLPRQSRVEDLAFYILGHAALVCREPFELEVVAHRQRRLESQHHGKTTTHDGYLDLDEFRNINRQRKKPGESSERINITHRLELDGTKYNYASLAKGAKVVAHNKEAKGAGNILGKDHDKYLINPCSVGGKFVVVELAEETLVDAVKIANFEHHSCNFKEFELLGSLTYPTETWSFLGKFMASNVKQAQTFTLPEPKWVRYLNLSLISHYRSEHYCTLSVFEVYGIDAIERMLEDLMVASEPVNLTAIAPSNLEVVHMSSEGENSSESSGKGIEKIDDGRSVNSVPSQTLVDPGKILDHIPEVKPKPSNRIPGDTVLKILLQKVRSLELNLSVLEGYLRELSRRQGDVLPVLDKEISRISANIENGRKEIMELLVWKDSMDKEVEDMEFWKALVSSQMSTLMDENRKLRSEVENVATNQSSLESREFAVLAINLFFMCVAFLMLVSRRVQTSFGDLGHGVNEAAQSRARARSTKGWMVILVSSCLTMLIGLAASELITDQY
ncbi:hypothetical protein V2J09_004813 [Rumex salicifolius]